MAGLHMMANPTAKHLKKWCLWYLSKNVVLRVTDNNHLIVRAFATAWKYRELYECDGGVDNIIRNLHTSPRQFYRYLDIAYMNPDKINKILSGKLKINVNDLFKMAAENQL